MSRQNIIQFNEGNKRREGILRRSKSSMGWQIQHLTRRLSSSILYLAMNPVCTLDELAELMAWYYR
jgi:hypothetical protein